MRALPILLVLSTQLHASNTLTFKEISEMGNEKKVISQSVNTKKSATRRGKSYKKELDEANKKLEAYRHYTRIRYKTPLILEEFAIGEGDYVGAISDKAIFATSIPSTVTFSNIQGANLPKSAKVMCEVYTKFKRICGNCTRLIINGKGQDIKAELNNRDGSSCIIGKVIDAEEKYMTGILISEMAKGALAVSQTSLPTLGGNVVENTTRNKLAQGLLNTADKATDIMSEKFKTQEPLVTFPRGQNVIIQFKEGVNL